jgi:putative oxidoreductase
MESPRHDMTTSIGLLILRLGMGGYMMTHGWPKLQKVLAGNFEFADPLGVGAAPSLVLAVTAEFFCALLVMLGLATRLAAIPVVITMAVAAFIVHAADPWTMGGGASKEPALLYLTAFLTLIFTGAGKLSLDALLWPRWRGGSNRPAAE